MDFLKTLRSEHFKSLNREMKMNTINRFIIGNVISRLEDIVEEFDKNEMLFNHYIERSNKYVELCTSLNPFYVFFNNRKSHKILEIASKYGELARSRQIKTGNLTKGFKNNYASLRRYSSKNKAVKHVNKAHN